jgi:hypothetical protein
LSDEKDLLDGLTDEQVASIAKTFEGLIDRVEPRIWYAENRRSSFATIAVALLAAGIALLAALLVNHASYRPALWGLVTLGIGAVVTGSVVLLVYSGQTNFDYPFKKKTTTWKWFYRDALPGTKSLAVPWHTIQRKADRERATELFDKDWAEFVTRQKTLTDVRISAVQDMQQLFVLHVNEFYKNKFLTQIRRVLSVGVAITVLAALGVFLGLVASCHSTRNGGATTTTLGVLIDSDHGVRSQV